MSKIVTFGEIMLRLSPNGFERLFQNDAMKATFGGAEANVAVSLAGFGDTSYFVTKVPVHKIGDGAVSALKGAGVDTSFIVRCGERLGIYYYEKGAANRSSLCIYDRAGSSIQKADSSDFDWDTIFEAADWFHFTGITPALGGSLVSICKEACEAAKRNGVKISCDLNYRNKLWSREEAEAVMSELCNYVDVCIGNEEDAEKIFGIETARTDVVKGVLDCRAYEETAKKLLDKFGFEAVAFSLRTSHSATCNDWAGMLYEGTDFFHSKQYSLDFVVDRVGSGDSFAAGVIHGMLHGWEGQEIIDFAAAASALKHSIEGDFNRVSVEEVQKLMHGIGTGRIER